MGEVSPSLMESFGGGIQSFQERLDLAVTKTSVDNSTKTANRSLDRL